MARDQLDSEALLDRELGEQAARVAGGEAEEEAARFAAQHAEGARHVGSLSAHLLQEGAAACQLARAHRGGGEDAVDGEVGADDEGQVASLRCEPRSSNQAGSSAPRAGLASQIMWAVWGLRPGGMPSICEEP